MEATKIDDAAAAQDPAAKNYALYFSFIYLGAVFLLPYNAFINAVDYFEFVFPDRNSEAIMIALNFSVTILLIMGSVVVVKLSDAHTRIRFGYVMFTLSLGTMIVLVAVLRGCGSNNMFAGLMLAVLLTSVGAGVQQASIYGFASQLPMAYPQAVMTGESTAGSIVSTVRIVTKLIGSDALRTSTVVYFGVTLGALLLGLLVHRYVKRHSIVQFYCQQGREAQPSSPASVESIPRERSGMCGVRYDPTPTDGNDFSTAEGDIEMDTVNGAVLTKYSRVPDSSSPDPDLQADKECKDSSAPEITEGSVIVGSDLVGLCSGTSDEEVGLVSTDIVRPLTFSGRGSKTRNMVRDGLTARLRILRKLWRWATVISVTYCLTLVLFPALLIKVPWHGWGSWTPVVLIAVFNYGDLLGKVLGPCFSGVSVNKLLVVAFVRLLLFPVTMLCILPCESPYFDSQHVEVTIVVSAVLGVSNGVIGTLAMSRAPKTLPRKDQEVAGMLMILSCMVGLTIGAYIAVGIAGGICNTSCTPPGDTTNTSSVTMSTLLPATTSPFTVSQASTVVPVSQYTATPQYYTSKNSTAPVSSTTATTAGLVCASTCMDSDIH